MVVNTGEPIERTQLAVPPAFARVHRYRPAGDWRLEDPHGRGTVAVRAIRDEIDVRVRQLLAELTERN